MALTKIKSSVIESGAIEASSLEDSGVTSGQYGSASAIPVLTVNQQGLVTAVSTTSVEGLPDQTGEAGNYLTTDGTTASWSTITQYTPPTDQGAGNFLAGDGTYKAVTVPTNVSELTNDSGYITGYTETNDLTSAVTWANVPDANITESSVTQHQASLSITESQISDLQSYLTSVSQSDVTQHQASLSITESQISDFGTYNNYTDTDVASYLSANDFDTATNIIASITDSAPTTLDTLNELAAALDDDPNFATTVSTNIGTKVSKSGDSMTGNLSFGDNDKAIFGAGSDLQIYHNGSHSYVSEAGTGNLYLNTTNGGGVFLTSAGENLAGFFSNGAVNLYYDNSKKLATTSTGVDVTGTVTADGLTVDGTVTATDSQAAVVPQLTLKNLDTGAYGSALNFNSYGALGYGEFTTAQISTLVGIDDGYLLFKTAENDTLKTRLRIDNNGDISFYDDTGENAKFFWDASTERLGINNSSPNARVDVIGSLGDSVDSENLILINRRSNQQDSAGFIGWNRWTATTPFVKIGAMKDNANNTGAFVIHTGSDQNSVERLRVTGTGNVGIGTSSPSAPLNVEADQNDVSTGSFTTPHLKLSASGTTNNTGFTGISYANSTLDNFGWTVGSQRTVTSGTVGAFVWRWHNNSATGEERMRIDSSGNLLVGTTDTQPAVNNDAGGVAVRENGQIQASSTSAPLSVSRKGSEGDIVQFRKDGATVGRIYSTSTGIVLGTPIGSGSGLHLISNAILPSTSTGGTANGIKDLGGDDDRFKDLYLSGDAHLDGTLYIGGVDVIGNMAAALDAINGEVI